MRKIEPNLLLSIVKTNEERERERKRERERQRERMRKRKKLSDAIKPKSFRTFYYLIKNEVNICLKRWNSPLLTVVLQTTMFKEVLYI